MQDNITFTFEDTILISRLEPDDAKEILKRFDIKAGQFKKAFLKVEKFSNDKNDNFDYDLSVELVLGRLLHETLVIKTSSNKDEVVEEYEKLKGKLHYRVAYDMQQCTPTEKEVLEDFNTELRRKK